MTIPPRPMLAATLTEADLANLPFPLLASPKIDGFRGMAGDNAIYSRTGKLFKNEHLQGVFRDFTMWGLDGELGVGSPTAFDFHEQVKRKFNTQHNTTPFNFYVFDLWNTDSREPYRQRLNRLADTVDNLPSTLLDHGCTVQLVDHTMIEGPTSLLLYEEEMIERGWEGICLRRPSGLYKNGRSTLKEGYLYKLKRFQDDEAEIIGWEERELNQNEQERSPHGFAARSSAASGKVPAGDLGAFTIRVLTGRFTGAQSSIGSGFTAEERRDFWRRRESFLGTTCTFKHFLPGAKDLPRHLVWKGLRED